MSRNASGQTVLRGDAVLFDCDGVLVDSADSTERAWTRWAHRYHLEPDDVLPKIHGRRSVDTVALFIPPEECSEAAAAIDAYELEDADSVREIPGAGELLAMVPSGRWAVVTSGTTALAHARLAAAGLPAPPAFITAEDVDHGKPAPDPYLSAAAVLGVKPGQAVVVEDSPSGIESGRRAGAAFVLGVGDMAVETDADVVVADLRGLGWSDGLVIPASAALPRRNPRRGVT